MCRVFKKPIPNDSRSKEDNVNSVINRENEYIDEGLKGDGIGNLEISRERRESDLHPAKLLEHDGFSRFPSTASSELTNQEQEVTPAGSALSTDHDLHAPLFTSTDEANSSANFYPFGFDYNSSNLIQVRIKLRQFT